MNFLTVYLEYTPKHDRNDGFNSHFTMLRILQYAQDNVHLRVGTLPQGFFKVSDMYRERFTHTVAGIEQFTRICGTLQMIGGLGNLKGTITELEVEDFICIGSAGYYYLQELKSNPQYLALMAIDTPMTSTEKTQKITDYM